MNEGKLANVTKEEILKYINKGWSYESIGAIYSVSGTSIKKKLKKFGIVLPKRRKISEKETFNKGIKFVASKYCVNCGKPIAKNYKYCSRECQIEQENKLRVKDWLEHPEKYQTEKVPAFVRRYLINKYQGCQICGWNEVNSYTGKSPLQVHHIDGNCLNNDINNLQLLCPNCHSLTDTFGTLNNGNSKRYAYKQYRKLYNQPLSS